MSNQAFPFPFTKDQYAYSNNSSILDPAWTVTVTEDYKKEIELKRELLQQNHSRCFRSLPISLESQWEVMRLVFTQLAEAYPSHFSFTQKGKECRFQNHLLNEEERFIFRDNTSINLEPLDLAGRHVQEDLILMGDRSDGLFLEAGQLCFPSNWSLTFVLGMEFKSIHHPVPDITDNGFIDKVERFISRIRPNTAWERKNWSITISEKLDTPLETYADWGRLRQSVTEENAGKMVHLRVEVQRLFRLPVNHDILFSIHTYLLSLEDIVMNEEWLTLFYLNIKTLDEDIADYKGISQYKKEILRYVEKTMAEKETMNG
ncbi:heme-dependent oxidative N-demethylase family protein [Pseudalkalibacillus sp. Hm43]|uniref:heme-dependent oxidative N-demethylase family protein n=1 Tax=Pseudalkalibacillus sp. Hm43 TaxID=3450742 RepID=UPI003F440A9F